MDNKLVNFDSRVVLSRVEEYDIDKIYETVKRDINKLIPLNELITKDTNVFIKLNCVGGYAPESGITTHPRFVEGVIRVVKEYTDNITIGDNPASHSITTVLKKNGIYDLINKYNLKLIVGENKKKITATNYKIYSSFDVSKDIIDSDLIINLPKLKTHTLTYMTCAQKNMFGFIFGLEKASWHAKAANPLEFGNALCDLYSAIIENTKGKILNICDGILGLEGEGPTTGGSPAIGNAIITSFDAVALDKVALKVAKLDPKRYFLAQLATERKLTCDDFTLIGDLNEFEDVKFMAPRNTISSIGLRIIRKKFMRNLLLEHPKVNHDICIRCGECAKICPAKTMHIEKGKFPSLKSKDCIRCWCCQEVCPKNAIYKTKRPIIGKIVFKIKL